MEWKQQPGNETSIYMTSPVALLGRLYIVLWNGMHGMETVPPALRQPGECALDWPLPLEREASKRESLAASLGHTGEIKKLLITDPWL